MKGKERRANNPVLLVEDNPDDVLITKRAWKKGQIQNQLIVVNNGEEALLFLRKEGKYSETPTPSLILLDLNMPRIDGFQVLELIKKSEKFNHIPVIVLTSSERSQDIDKAYKLGCNNYIVKPVSYEKFIEAVKIIELLANL